MMEGRVVSPNYTALPWARDLDSRLALDMNYNLPEKMDIFFICEDLGRDAPLGPSTSVITMRLFCLFITWWKKKKKQTEKTLQKVMSKG